MNINELPLLSSINDNDLIPFWSNTQGGTASISFANFVDDVRAKIYAKMDYVSQYITLTSGSTTNINDNQNNIFPILLGSGTIASATLILPKSTNTLDGQSVMVYCVPTVTTLTLSLNGALGANLPTTLAANSTFTLRYDAGLNTWYRVN